MASIQPLPFGTVLKRYRRAAGLTQEELAARAGYSAASISLLERNVRLPTPATIASLAEALDLSPAERS
jgi:transcriptional regulator with XRE-family HTH domain